MVGHRPSVLIHRLRTWLTDRRGRGVKHEEKAVENTATAIAPWARGFRGTISKQGDRHFTSKGCWRWVKEEGGELEVTELPLYVWLHFKSKLEKLELKRRLPCGTSSASTGQYRVHFIPLYSRADANGRASGRR